MFIDKARIYVEAGNGGDGMSSFRREKFVEKGGPNGGNGGRGGNVILRADNSLNTLIDFRYKRKFIAKRGDKGGISNMTGHRGEDVIIKVPLGTVVRDDETNIMIADLTEDGLLRHQYQTGSDLCGKRRTGNQRMAAAGAEAAGGCGAGGLSQRREIQYYLTGQRGQTGNRGLSFYHAYPGTWGCPFKRGAELCAGGHSRAD